MERGAYDCAIRQYSSCGRLDGWAGNLDINKCYISRTEWEAMAGGSNGDPSSLIHGIDETPTADLAAKVLAGELGDGEDRKRALATAIRRRRRSLTTSSRHPRGSREGDLGGRLR